MHSQSNNFWPVCLCNSIRKEQSFWQTLLRHLDLQEQKHELDRFGTPHTYVNSKWVADLNVTLTHRGTEKWCSHLGEQLGISAKCQTHGYLITQQFTPGEINIRPHKTEFTWLFTAILLITSTKWKLLKSISTDEEDNRKWSVRTMEYYLDIKVTKRWHGSQPGWSLRVMQTKRSQLEKITRYTIAFKWRVQDKQVHRREGRLAGVRAMESDC